jgi:hypothetical protein
MIQQADPAGFEVSLIVSLMFSFISVGGLLYTLYSLLGYKKGIISIWLLGIPFIILGAAGIIAPLVTGSMMTTEYADYLELAGVIPLFEGTALYLEVLALVAVFAIVCTLYIVMSQRMLIRNRTRKTWLIAVACSCAIEIAAAIALAFVSLTHLIGLSPPPAQGSTGRLFFFAAAIIILKLFEQMFVLVYVELFGMKRLVPDLGSITANDMEFADFATLKKLVRKQCGFIPIPLFVLLVSGLILWAHSYITEFGVLGLLYMTSGISTLYLPFIVLPAAILAIRALWFLYPAIHPLPRFIATFNDPDMVAGQLLREYRSPLFRAGNVIATPNFLICESLVLRAFYLPALVGIEARRGNGIAGGIIESRCGLFFDGGKELNFSPEQTELLEYARSKLNANETRLSENPKDAKKRKIRNVGRRFLLLSLALILGVILWNALSGNP